MSDTALRAIGLDGQVRAFACLSTELVNELQRRQDSWPVATAALGRTATIAAMMGLTLKNQERLTVQLTGDGPLGKLLVDADADGHVRGTVENPHIHLPANALGKLDVGGGVGSGLLTVMRDTGLKDVYRGSSELQSGEIADDFIYYFAVSEQVPSAIGAGVLVDTDNSVIVSGGFMLQLMPGHTAETIDLVEKNISSIPSVTDFLQSMPDAEALLRKVLPDARILQSQPISFQCTCSRERMLAAIRTLGEAEVRDMIERQHGAQTICHFCNEVYEFSEAELEALL